MKHNPAIEAEPSFNRAIANAIHVDVHYVLSTNADNRNPSRLLIRLPSHTYHSLAFVVLWLVSWVSTPIICQKIFFLAGNAQQTASQQTLQKQVFAAHIPANP
jgi:hypothetical protein